MRIRLAIGLALALAGTGVGLTQPGDGGSDAALVGLWEAKRSFGPEVRGPLVLVERDGRLVADIAGFSVPVATSGLSLHFALPDQRGSFRGTIGPDGREAAGFWIQPVSALNGSAYATPVTLRRENGSWRGEVTPLEQSFSYYLPVSRGSDGRLRTFLRNPERNDGIFSQAQFMVREGAALRLIGNRRGRSEEIVLREGRFDPDGPTLSFPGRGGTYDFIRVDEQSRSPFHPRGPTPAPYRYAPPLQRDDGWRTATLEQVGISRPAIEAFVQRLIDARMSSVNDSQIHSVLIARHGKLVLEEYFHGFDRDRPHDMRSAAKSLLAVLIGAAMEAGIAVDETTPVYRTMIGSLPADLDPRKRAMTLGNLLTMTGGHYCDDNDDEAPGNENRMQEQNEQPDWYRYILALPMDRNPGEKIVYCSADAHLAGGVLARVAGEPLPELFDRLVAKPLRMGRYHLNLAPTGEAYMGGGAYFLPRDFMKLAQLMVNEGRWGDRRIVSREWALKSGAALRDLSPIQRYGYFWNSAEYPYRGRKVRAVFAGGNGGQIFMAIPELDLVIAFTGGNYGDPSFFIPQRVLVPEQILPAVN